MRHRSTEPLLHMLAASALSGLILGPLLVVVWAAATGTGPLLFTTFDGLGAVMLITALAGLFGCAAFGTSLGADEHIRGGHVPLCLAVARIRSRASRVRPGPPR